MTSGADAGVAKGDLIDLEWKLVCKESPNFKVNGTYFIIGKDPTRYKTRYYTYLVSQRLEYALYN